MLKLPNGDYVNPDHIQELISDDNNSCHLYYSGNSTWVYDAETTKTLLAAIEAPIQVKTFVKNDSFIDWAIANVRNEVNAFLANLQPWQVVKIESQSIITPDVNYHIITITYREPKATTE